ncbi:hypothetical protein [Rhizobium sp. SL86]|uniref:hypothetical protein n=1 Tax=Rhizobium sp. SL86 TaxID=2995148 RepID=UPI002275BDD1|nr:hypothetical protein [Rhizobium sp. SL86]MCY1669301.1 hypothetical protein [Rhizobium sp. SL86]
MDTELSITELANDPLIGLLMRADGVDQEQLSELLGRTARLQVAHLQDRIRQARAEEFYSRLDLVHALRPANTASANAASAQV